MGLILSIFKTIGKGHFLILLSLGIPSLCPFQRGRKQEERLQLCSGWPMGLQLGGRGGKGSAGKVRQISCQLQRVSRGGRTSCP